MSTQTNYEDVLQNLSPQGYDQLIQEAIEEAQALIDGANKPDAWAPHPDNKPQNEAYNSPAFETLYGGAAGGGKSDLLLGLARTRHQRSLILRRTFPDLERSVITRSHEFYGDTRLYNGSKHLWSLEGRRIEFGHLEYEKDVAQYQSAQYDFIGFDELTQFTRLQYEYMLSRARTTKQQRVRIVAASNPGGEGNDWVMERWGAWLNAQHPNPAKSGDIRWFKRDAEGKDVECAADDPDGVSRTFILAKLRDNPLLSEDYRKTLNMLPEPYRSQLLDGDWQAGIIDDAWQVIPTAWVEMAIERGRQRPKPESMMTTMGIDCVWGGNDKMVLAPRYDNWFAPLEKTPGAHVPDGRAAVRIIKTSLLKHGAAAIEETDEGRKVVSDVPLQIDAIGYGAATYEQAKMSVVDEKAQADGEVKQSLNARAINFAESASGRDRSGRFGFINMRARMYWKFREALDPIHGEDIALPDDAELKADLCAPRYSIQSNGIKVEPKPDIKVRLGRSPDCGDAVVQAHGGSIRSSVDFV